MKRALVLAIACVAAGCARNAILEVELTLPPGSEGQFVMVQFETGAIAFEDEWARTDDYPGVELGSAEQVVRYSLVSDDEPENVRVKLRVCRTPGCTVGVDATDTAPGLWFDLEHPLYIGERTTWRERITALPTAPPTSETLVDKCEIEGCIRAEGETTYCRTSGAHYCEE